MTSWLASTLDVLEWNEKFLITCRCVDKRGTVTSSMAIGSLRQSAQNRRILISSLINLSRTP